MFGIPFLTPKLAIQLGCGLAIVGAIWFGIHTIQADAVKTLVAQDTAHAAVVEAAGAKIDAAQSAVDAKSSEDNAVHQTAEAAVAAVIKRKVKVHVHEAPPASPAQPARVGCVSVGLVRQHDAAALGVDPDTLPLPSGVADDACSTTTNAELAEAISDNYAAARANAVQLNDLIENVKGKVDATDPPH